MNNWDIEKRFEVVYKQNSMMTTVRILVDRETGVQYLLSTYGQAGGLTMLVDKDGKPLLYQR